MSFILTKVADLKQMPAFFKVLIVVFVLFLKIRSDLDEKTRVTYSLSGAGADQPPVNRFTINSDTGAVRVNEILDREEIHQYNVSLSWS